MPFGHGNEPPFVVFQPSAHAGELASGGEIVAEYLLANGVGMVFGYPGGAVMPLYDDLHRYRDRIRHILVRHEQGAVHAAQAYARVTGKPGVAIGASGPGATNLLTGILDARLDSTPLVVIGGQVATHLIGNDAFQECDMMGMTNPITKHNFQPRSIDELPAVLHKAFYIARTGRPGPVYIDLPHDVQLARARRRDAVRVDLPSYVASRPLDQPGVSLAARVLKGAERPLIVIGHGSIHAEATDALRALASALCVPVGTTLLGKGSFDENSPLSIGCVGPGAHPAAAHALLHCDVLIAVGCRLSDRITGEPRAFAQGKKIIHVDIDPYEIGKSIPVTVGLNCDAREVAEALLTAMRGFRGPWTAWTETIQALRAQPREPAPGREATEYVLEILNTVLAEDDVVTTGAGEQQMGAAHILRRSKPRTFLTSGGAGTLGFGLPSAIGAAIAKPWVNVWAIEGDGGLQMTVQELGTLKQCHAKVVIVLLDTARLGLCLPGEPLPGERRSRGIDPSLNPDFLKLAEAYGIEGRSCEDGVSLVQALRYAQGANHSVLVHIPMDRVSTAEPVATLLEKANEIAAASIPDALPIVEVIGPPMSETGT
jgi:acetolactate synthase-1/2/3 large subunit